MKPRLLQCRETRCKGGEQGREACVWGGERRKAAAVTSARFRHCNQLAIRATGSTGRAQVCHLQHGRNDSSVAHVSNCAARSLSDTCSWPVLRIFIAQVAWSVVPKALSRSASLATTPCDCRRVGHEGEGQAGRTRGWKAPQHASQLPSSSEAGLTLDTFAKTLSVCSTSPMSVSTPLRQLSAMFL